ncbi:4'-phosphopantetheinyl transferase superfamily protein [Clostridium gasigenes]|uniref:4'-phosphopantetheinyl transferase family protein n=1 Tax=Clostridium gasigenes TaxID=94869 RepID=UPI001629747B|nr:4'-phosphopantetheinyl transferase superfamily protein [Clostridium gasigenes]MBB6625535.1 4'-phosphopantetheinyl transferase superfamily protein [Clostridium gasigenes]
MSNKTKLIVINYINSYNINNLQEYTDKLYKKDTISKFIFNTDKINAILSEMLIRVLYCEKNGISNNSIVFNKNKFGKPYIENCKDFHFNISHSNDMVVGIIDNEQIGIDVEYIQELEIDVAKCFCTNNEYSTIVNQKKQNRGKFITSIWSLKEAYIKYLGTGLSEDLLSFDIINKDNINPDINLYSQMYNDYTLCVCTKKKLQLNSIIEEITIDALIERYRSIC